MIRPAALRFLVGLGFQPMQMTQIVGQFDLVQAGANRKPFHLRPSNYHRSQFLKEKWKMGHYSSWSKFNSFAFHLATRPLFSARCGPYENSKRTHPEVQSWVNGKEMQDGWLEGSSLMFCRDEMGQNSCSCNPSGDETHHPSLFQGLFWVFSKVPGFWSIAMLFFNVHKPFIWVLIFATLRMRGLPFPKIEPWFFSLRFFVRDVELDFTFSWPPLSL